MRNTILPKNYSPTVIEPEIVEDRPETNFREPRNVFVQNNYQNNYYWPEQEEDAPVVCDWSMTRKMGYAYKCNPILSTILLFGPLVFILGLYFLFRI